MSTTHSKKGRKRLFIIDSMAMAFRSFYALGRTPLYTSHGTPTGALLGTALFMNKLIDEERPDYLIAAAETGKASFRQAIFKDYKANRDVIPDDLLKQLPHFFRLLECYGCPIINFESYEADDVIATLSRIFSDPNLDIYIVSGDKDFYQLVDDKTFVYSPKKGEKAVIIDRSGVHERFHCKPEQMIDCLALMGDSSDNVPGVRGIGEKGAAKLIEQFGSLEGIYDNLEKITAKKQRESLEQNKEMAFLSRKLVTLKDDVPLNINLEDFRCDPSAVLASDKLIGFFQEFDFKQLADRSAARPRAQGAPTASPTLTIRNADDSDSTFVNVSGKAYEDIFVSTLETSDEFSLYLASQDRHFLQDKIEGYCFGFAKGDQRILFHIAADKIKDRLRDAIQNALISEKKSKIIHDVKCAMHLLSNSGLALASPYMDTMLCDYLLDPGDGRHSLIDCAEKHLRSKPSDSHDWRRSCQLADMSLELNSFYKEQIKSLGLTKVLHEVELPLIPVLADMERLGVYIDVDFLLTFSDRLEKTAGELQAKIYEEAGESFNINSPKQLQHILFEKKAIHIELGLTRLKKTKNGFSTDESVLQKMIKHPLAKLILDYRQVAKLKGTYVDSLPQQINPTTGRLHTHFQQAVTATGRLSSDKPNLQNIPLRSQLGQEMRKAFRPKDNDWTMISADYSQVEIRLLAVLANEKSLLEAFAKDEDIHAITASKIFGVAEDKVTSELRSRAKAVNFGIIYGMGPQRLSQSTGVSMGEAKDFIEKYFNVYPGIKAYTQSLIAKAKDQGFTTTILGRRRPIPSINDSNGSIRARAENIAINAPIQGSAADLIKIAMCKIADEFGRLKCQGRLLLQIHDELLFECPKSETDELIPVIRDCMENAIKTAVPFKVEIGSGKDWLSAH